MRGKGGLELLDVKRSFCPKKMLKFIPYRLPAKGVEER